jgi:hypothetical protein
MTVRPLSYLLVFVLGFGAAALGACGSSSSSKSLIPVADAGPLQNDFDAVASAIADHDCPGSSSAIRRAQAHVDSLPRATSEQLTQRLQDGLQTLQRQAADECVATVATTTTETTTTETTTTDTVPTDTLPTDTIPTDTLPTDTIPTDTTTTPTPNPNPGGTGVLPGQFKKQQKQPGDGDGGTVTP